ncbi:fructosamine kinase family protein [Parvularcula sp. LCG005]|uniref:fructosamine kinase family protein n=1 Tax=Parvularcula sp. LCG005 TaxID=3078805 RepID=UPI002942FB69|nr:fructosamine kinase family protein [Parvularcula sp. LCG005]WOI53729.1 fructosamine kinase family protein [Parvularcula sp. LCG005]
MDIGQQLGSEIVASQFLGQGTSGAGTVLTRHDLADGRSVVTKEDGTGGLEPEAHMLRYLADKSSLPVPHLWYADDHVIVMDYLPGGEGVSGNSDVEVADAIAALHSIGTDNYGFDRDTLIGPLQQPNEWTSDWWTFFGEQRLSYMANLCVEAGRADIRLVARVEELAARLPELLDAPRPPGLVHGDLWGGNILCSDGRLSGFIDPAICFADPEMDLAYGTLFGTLGPQFFERYADHHPLSADFWAARRDIYNLWPLLVHVRLFGGHYLGEVTAILRRYGAH